MQLVNKGYKVYEFANGDKVNATFNKEVYAGVFIGSLRSESVETMVFTDKKYDLKAEITFGKVKKRYPWGYADQVTFSSRPSIRMANLSVSSMGVTVVTSTSRTFATGTVVSSKLLG